MENQFKGTKEKMSVSEIRVKSCYISIVSEKGLIARTFYDELGDIISEKEAEANALLISKAPEMLEMLMDTSNALYMGGSPGDLAIAKAIDELIKSATTL